MKRCYPISGGRRLFDREMPTRTPDRRTAFRVRACAINFPAVIIEDNINEARGRLRRGRGLRESLGRRGVEG